MRFHIMIITNKGGGRVEKYDSYGKKHASNTKYSKQNKTHKANQKKSALICVASAYSHSINLFYVYSDVWNYHGI